MESRFATSFSTSIDLMPVNSSLKRLKGFHVDGPVQVSPSVYGEHLKGNRPAQGRQPEGSVSKETRQTKDRKKQFRQPNVTDGKMT